MNKPIQIEDGEWWHKGNFIQKQPVHPKLTGRYEVFRDTENQFHIGRASTLSEAIKLSEKNPTIDYLHGPEEFGVKRKSYRFFYHYNRHFKKISLHSRGTCEMVDNIRVEVPTESKWNESQQPNLVIQGMATEITIVNGKAIIK